MINPELDGTQHQNWTTTMAVNAVVDWEVDGTQFEVDVCDTSGHNFKNQYTCWML
jgi:hypothetical protein